MKSPFLGRPRKRKLLLALIIGVFAISILGFSKSIDYAPDNDLSAAKHYNDKGECPGIGISNAKLKTKFSDSKVYYMLNLTVAKGKKRELPQSFTIKLVDKDGFDIQYFTIASSSLTEELDNSENSVGYSYQSVQLMDADTYKSVTGWNLIWAFD